MAEQNFDLGGSLMREAHSTSLQGNRNPNSDVLPEAEGIRWAEDGAAKAAEGVGEGKRTAEAAGGGAVVGEAGTVRMWHRETSKP